MIVFLQLYIYRHPESVSRPLWARKSIPTAVIRYFAVVWMVFFLLLFVLSFLVDPSKLTIVDNATT